MQKSTKAKTLESKEIDGELQVFFSGGSPVKESAGFIVRSYEEGRSMQFRAVGANAVCQMYKTMATVRSILAQKGLDVSYRPGFATTKVEREGKTMELTVLIGYMDVRKD